MNKYRILGYIDGVGAIQADIEVDSIEEAECKANADFYIITSITKL